jgi:hypothetical protein
MPKAGDKIGRAFGKLVKTASQGQAGRPKSEDYLRRQKLFDDGVDTKKGNQGKAGRPVSDDYRRRQMLFDYGIDIDKVKKTLKRGRR